MRYHISTCVSIYLIELFHLLVHNTNIICGNFIEQTQLWEIIPCRYWDSNILKINFKKAKKQKQKQTKNNWESNNWENKNNNSSNTPVKDDHWRNIIHIKTNLNADKCDCVMSANVISVKH